MNGGSTQPQGSGVMWLTLFASTGTLICCALPIVLVALGFGASVAALTSAMPFLITLSQNKIWVFALSAIILSMSGWLLYRPDRRCSSNPEVTALCERVFVWNRAIYWTSVVVWVIGFFAAYLLLPLTLTLV